jgi:hypothetical protein
MVVMLVEDHELMSLRVATAMAGYHANHAGREISETYRPTIAMMAGWLRREDQENGRAVTWAWEGAVVGWKTARGRRWWAVEVGLRERLEDIALESVWDVEAYVLGRIAG